MARLTQDQIRTHIEWLSGWRTPEGVFSYVGDINTWMGSEDFFSQPGTTFLRDAWTGAALAKARDIEEIRLVKDEWPDIELKTSHGVERVECVEADLPGRQRAREYQEAADSGTTGGRGQEGCEVISARSFIGDSAEYLLPELGATRLLGPVDR